MKTLNEQLREKIIAKAKKKNYERRKEIFDH